MYRYLLAFSLSCCLLLPQPGAAQPAAAPAGPGQYTRREVLIPKRDGVQRSTVSWAPKEPKGPLPLLRQRPLYGVQTQGRPEESAYPRDLPGTNHVFRPGHRLMVQVQSSWFPLIDRHPQTFMPRLATSHPFHF